MNGLSARPLILLASHTEDPHCAAVEQALSRRNYRCFRLNTNAFPEQVRVTLTIGSRFEGVIDATPCGGGIVQLAEVQAALYRRPEPPRYTAFLTPEHSKFALSETRACLDSIYNALQGRWLSDPYAMLRARDKALQLSTALAVGLKVPETYITNCPESVPKGDSVIYKTLRSSAIETELQNNSLGIFTTILTEDLRTHLDQLRVAPGIFQRYIEKEYELRITVCGSRFFACQIDSQSHNDAKIDWRAVEPSTLAHTMVSLPDEVVANLRALLLALNIRFGCIDMIVTPSGEYVLLEVNPNGQWLWIEHITGAPIADAIAEELGIIATS
jgi:glutathione synthase/RimK-type ligase-like ATP-grasp enzyme